jgi:hypothetical protein
LRPTDKDRHTDLVFETPDVLRQRRLGDIEYSCRSSNVSFPADSDEGSQQSERDTYRLHERELIANVRPNLDDTGTLSAGPPSLTHRRVPTLFTGSMRSAPNAASRSGGVATRKQVLAPAELWRSTDVLAIWSSRAAVSASCRAS